MRFVVARFAALILFVTIFTPPHPVAAQDSSYRDTSNSVHAEAIEAISQEGIADGCEPDAFCPGDPVSRGQMASFLAQALELDEVDEDHFTDDDDSVHHGAINAVAAADIAQGCDEDRFCPQAPITRAQMATFLAVGFELDEAAFDWFTDENGNIHEESIDNVADAGVTAGCDDVASEFCPGDHVTRGQMATFLARALELVPRASLLLEAGAQGPQVEVIQTALEDRGYWVGPIDGIYGQLTEQAIFAVQKQRGLLLDGIVGPEVRAALGNPQAPNVRSDSGTVWEVDKTNQLLHLVRDGEAVWTWNTSTGTEDYYTYEGRRYKADTPNGRWDVYREIDGWRESHLGELYRPKYFHTDGIAVHGYTEVPPYPASHGCVRVTIEAMDWIWESDVMPIGSDVWVYGQTPTS